MIKEIKRNSENQLKKEEKINFQKRKKSRNKIYQ